MTTRSTPAQLYFHQRFRSLSSYFAIGHRLVYLLIRQLSPTCSFSPPAFPSSPPYSPFSHSPPRPLPSMLLQSPHAKLIPRPSPPMLSTSRPLRTRTGPATSASPMVSSPALPLRGRAWATDTGAPTVTLAPGPGRGLEHVLEGGPSLQDRQGKVQVETKNCPRYVVFRSESLDCYR